MNFSINYLFFIVYYYEMGCVLDFVGKVMVVFNMFYIEFNVMVCVGKCIEGEMYCICIIGLNVFWEFFMG